MRKINTINLTPGMVVSRDVYSMEDQLILPEGFHLTDSTITRLTYYMIPFVYVKNTDNLDKLPSDSLLDVEPYSLQIRNSPEFKKFSAEFRKDVFKLKNMLNDIVEKNAPLNVDDILNDALSLLDNTHTHYHVFDMLHNLRTYDDSTYTHALNVALICNVLASWLNFSEKDVHLATQCGLFHDIGKLKIPEEIIKKPDRLTDQEYDIIKQHPMEGYKILKRCQVDPHISYSALMHHERSDGKGYPLGYTSDKIDKFAKIVAIADVYDAMTAARVYRGPLCPFKVIDVFEQEGFQKYDTKYILTFLENVVSSYLSHRVRLSDGREGTIFFINKQRLSRPILKCDESYIDLLHEPSSVFIDAII
ncbi:MAG: HD-GYP domain-containing protein [Lachnospiraceae bacterium]|nr:HD-GYP domain-containing protein [Lachnospiraceae bacterium]